MLGPLLSCLFQLRRSPWMSIYPSLKRRESMLTTKCTEWEEKPKKTGLHDDEEQIAGGQSRRHSHFETGRVYGLT